MNQNIISNSVSSIQFQSCIGLGGAANKKWPARIERTIYHNLTIGLKDLGSFGKRKFL